jgi:hypothetical protein
MFFCCKLAKTAVIVYAIENVVLILNKTTSTYTLIAVVILFCSLYRKIRLVINNFVKLQCLLNFFHWKVEELHCTCVIST